ncbi:MAG: SWIM zinc finger family protein [Deinococcota bacterium]
MAQPLNLQYIRNLFGSTIFERGQTYFKTGRVSKLSLAGTKLTASVQGSDIQPYNVTITLRDEGSASKVDRASCTCPYEREFGGYCKHIAAVLLKYHHEGVEEDSSNLADDLLKVLLELPQQDLRTVLSNTFKHQPEVVNLLYIQLQQHVRSTPEPSASAHPESQSDAASSASTSAPDTSTASTGQVSLDTRPFVLLMEKAAASPSMDYDGFPDYRDVYDVLDEVKPFYKLASYRDALELMWDLIGSYIRTVNSNEAFFDHEVGFSDESLVYEMDKLLAEALLGSYGTLTRELTEEDRDRRLEQLHNWEDDMVNEWFDASLSLSIHALTYGPTSEHLSELHKYKQSTYNDIVLAVLRTQGKPDDALNFAKANVQEADYLLMLVERGDLEMLKNVYRDYLHTVDDVQQVAEAITDLDASLAITLLQYGLDLTTRGLGDDTYRHRGDILNFTHYAINFAQQQGNTQLNLDANLISFQIKPSVEAFDALHKLTPDWSTLKQSLLSRLRNPHTFYNYDYRAAATLFLREHLYDEAVHIATRALRLDDRTLVFRVMKAVYSSHTNWVIDTSKTQAEEIMDAGNASRYGVAVSWLGQVREAYLATDQIEPWETYIQAIAEKHKRKRKLMGLMKPLLE